MQPKTTTKYTHSYVSTWQACNPDTTHEHSFNKHIKYVLRSKVYVRQKLKKEQCYFCIHEAYRVQ